MEQRPERRRLFMGISIVSNFGMLGFFKYFNFFVDNVHAVLEAAGLHVGLPVLRVILPVGISFYTFQAMSYTMDVFRGELRARRSLLDVAVFISFFPHLVAGPIQRASYLLPQVEQKRRFICRRPSSGFYLMVWGFFKKLVIADNVGVIANKVFALNDPSFEVLWAGVFAFAIQIYADFSAYTDIARGSSRWLGFELTENFDHPYLARNPADFWRRWNISLSTWFRDYVYIPLGGSRASEWIWGRNVLITFLLSGLWHGASWNYVLWGLYHGVLLVITRAHQILKPPPPSPLRGFGETSGLAAIVTDRWDVRAYARRVAALPRDSAFGDRPRPAARAVEQLALRAAGGALPLPAGVRLFDPALGAERLGGVASRRAAHGGWIVVDRCRAPEGARLRRRLHGDSRPA